MLTDFVCLYTCEFLLSLCKIVQSSVILLLHLFSILSFGDILLPDDGATSPLSIAVEKWHFDIVKHIFENITDLSDTSKSPLYLATERGYYDI